MEKIVLTEHQTYNGKSRAQIEELLDTHHIKLVGIPTDYMGTPHKLALDSSLTASYYIGATWLVEKELPVVVLPKIPHIDYLEMFTTALSVSSKHESEYFSKSYGIDFNQPPIETEEKLNQLTPLLLVHYITLLEKLIDHGLKKDYIQVTENLKNKIKGRLVISQHIKKNIIPGRNDRNLCTYQIYTADIPINRLLKKALIFAQKMLIKCLQPSRHTAKLQFRINKIMSAFNGVSDNIELSMVKQCSNSKLFKHYSLALKVAKDILRRYDYSLSNISNENKQTPCFWIDMSRLFELYVYSKLYEAYKDNIKFQVKGYQKSAVDYIHIGERIIIDAKYKPRYDNSNSGILPDIREISGYSRDMKILENFGEDYRNSNEEIKCLIIYPQNAFEDLISIEKDEKEFQSSESSLWSQATGIKEFRNFKKLKISLPTIL